MALVPYTTTYSAADREYLGNRIGKSPKISEVLELGKLANDVRQLAQKLDTDTGLAQQGTYESAVIND